MTLSRLLWWRPPCVLRAVIVTPTNDHASAIRGVLWGYRGAWLTLREVSILRAGSAPTPIDGELVIHRSNVAYMQVIP